MYALKSLCFALFAVNAVAAPFNQTLEARGKDLLCKNTEGNFKINSDKAERAMHAAPVGNPPDKLPQTKSGYPHQFHNAKGLKWANSHCNDKNAKLLEFPVFADGHLFQYDEKKNPSDASWVGPARVIYTMPSKDYCGVMAHTTGNKGDFELCE
ncbi:ribotoxin [Diplodia corticola]|uniref:Ribotoxin n=1 Tax=Diplodia corticola TaxID=236234 RepID=A0A1J9SC35_9PEZI|nr:ribotoxin [Diplodia corticola]OJD38023.1 ribotoxin [Diplodia corticola]